MSLHYPPFSLSSSSPYLPPNLFLISPSSITTTSSPSIRVSLSSPSPSPSSSSSSFKPKPPHLRSKKCILSPSPSSSMAARDMVIDFGKYKGTMMGTLPSKYLRWLCKNLRAGDYLEWAKRADEVLEDPVYLDRIEWEQADALLTGNSNIRVEYPISHRLLELSQRFEWDNDNADGWKRIDFSLLGTSKGARIPRIRDRKGFSSHNTMLQRQSNVGSAQMMDREVFPLKNNLGSAHMRDGEVFSSKRDEGFTQTRNIEVFSSKKNKGSSHIGSRVPHGADGEESGLREELLRRRREGRRGRQRFRNEELRASGDGLEEKSALGGVFNPFPGRESLLMKMNIIPP